jgi:pimeloyl-ACP methyl ester carboxylesterase
MASMNVRLTPRMFHLNGLRLSGLDTGTIAPSRGVVLALHGGGYQSSYWAYPSGSLADHAIQRRFRTVLIDRPGYGAAYDVPRNLADQAEIVFDLVEAIRREENGAPVLVVGHSMGGILALMMAAHPRSQLIAGVDVCGVPLVFPDHMIASLTARTTVDGQTHYPLGSLDGRRKLFYGPDGTFDEAALAYDAQISTQVPVAEFPDALHAPVTLPGVMRTIKIPVRYSMSEFEVSSTVDRHVQEKARALLSGASRVTVRVEDSTGHNISLHKVAGAFHSGILDCFDQILL